MKKYNYGPVLMGVICLGISACSGAPKKVDLLEKARADYKEVSQDATIAKHAPLVLDKAREALESADTRWKNKDDKWRVEHYAYLANQRIETARLISEGKQTEQEIESMRHTRQSLTLQQREAELREVRQQAEKLRQQQLQAAEQQREAELLAARQEADRLKQQMAELLEAEETDRGMVLTLGDVLFDVGEASLAPGAARNIAKIATFMRNYPERVAVIEGHTDSMGEADFNLDLSRDRAFSVRDALIDAGVEATRLSTQGFGEKLPVASNDNSAGRQKNRRVEIIFPDESTKISEFDDY